MFRNFGQGRHALGTYIVYIGGVEVPVNSVDIHFAIGGQDPVAVLSLAPHRSITRLGAEDRLEVQVFFLDQISYPGKPEYRLLFEGSISGWAFQRDAVQVAVTVTAQGLLNILRVLTAEYLTSVTALANFDPLKGTNIAIADSDIVLPWKLIFFGIGQEATQTKLELKRVKRPFDFVFNFLRLVFDNEAYRAFGSVPCAYFYSLYHQKHNLFYRFLPSPIVETTAVDFTTTDESGAEVVEKRVLIPVLDALQNQAVALAAMARSASAQGFSVPAWDMILQMLQQLYFEVQQMPAPPCVLADFDINKDTFGLILAPADERGGRHYQEVMAANKPGSEKPKTTTRMILPSAITKPNWFFGAVPMCNVIFPSMLQEVHFEENYWAQPTRLIVNDNSLFNFFGESENVFGPLLAFSSAYPEAVEKEILKRAYSGNDPYISGKNLLVWPEEFYKGVVEHGIALPEWLMFLTEAQIQDESNEAKRTLGTVIQEIFAASAEFGKAVAKLGVEGELQKLKQEVEHLERQIKLAEDAKTKEKLNKELEEKRKNFNATMDSRKEEFKEGKEKYKQKLKLLIQRVSKSPALSEQTRRLLFDAQGNVVDNPDIIEKAVYYLMRDTRGALYDIYRKYATFEYWRLRGEQRAGALTMTFNPFIIPGFPIFVFEAAATGQHFFAYVTDVRHELSPAGRFTQINFTHVMLLSEYIELLLQVKKLLKGIQRKDRGTFLVRGVSGYELALELYNGWFFKGSSQGSLFKEPPDLPIVGESIPGKDSVSPDIQKEFDKPVPDDVKLESVFIRDLISVPLNPIMQLALVSQTGFGADLYFNALLWQFTNGHRDSVFNPLTMLNLVYYDNKTRKEIVNRLDQVMDYLLEEGTDMEERLRNALNYAAVRPIEKFFPAMENYEEALRTIRRPVCSLKQFIDFISATNDTKVSAGFEDRGLAAPVQLYTAPAECEKKYWYGVEPKFNEETNALIEPDVVTKLPRHRRDWAKRLLEYRSAVTKEYKK